MSPFLRPFFNAYSGIYRYLWGMIFRKVIEIRKPVRLYDRGDRFALWGSCFSTRLRDHLMEALYDVSDSPYGIMYNPLSMAQGMERLLSDDAPQEEELILRDGRWHSMMHHGAFSHSSREVALQGMRLAFERSRAALAGTDLLILTLGTAWVYERQGEVVNNCHKLPAEDFTRRRLSVDEIVSDWSRLIPLTDRAGTRHQDPPHRQPDPSLQRWCARESSQQGDPATGCREAHGALPRSGLLLPLV